MKSRKTNIFITHYLREKSISVLIYFTIVLIFLAVAGLYGYDNSVIHMLYAAVIIAFFGLCFGAVDYFRYRSKCLKLLDASVKRGESDYYLPKANNLPEQIYRKMVCLTEEEKRELISEGDEKKRDMADYYTMWTHQIKTPIAAMRLLLRRENAAEVAKQASKELFKIEQYTEMALYYARLDSMASDMLFQQYDICAVVKQAVKKYSVLFIESRLSFSLEELECRAVTDEKWLSFVIEQILSNALKYTSEGGIRIYGIAEKKELSGGKVNQIVIEDTGIGIRESDLPRIFERGFTGYNGRMDQKSTGIGLYLCKQIMDKLSHTIKVESAPGQGSRVILGFSREKYE